MASTESLALTGGRFSFSGLADAKKGDRAGSALRTSPRSPSPQENRH